MKNQSEIKIPCAHCGIPCESTDLQVNDNYFCCHGCHTVFQLLHEHQLDDYYRFSASPGLNPNIENQEYEFLEDQAIIQKLLDFQEDKLSKVTLHLPQIHCSSCLFLLENLNRLNAGILESKVNFNAKKAAIFFDSQKVSLRELVYLLSKIGYAPRLNLDSLESQNQENKKHKRLLYQIGLAGFSFGNIMLLSFPEYLGFDKASYLFHIGYINIILATPLLLYSSFDYIKSAWQGIKMNHLNIDLPIALGMVTLYLRSCYEILGHHGEGYLDSFAGFIFFLLIGKWFQQKTFDRLDFDRNYKSYFPISVLIKQGEDWISQSIDKLNKGDLMLIKNQQLIPADGTLIKGKARLDYSFVTGESELINKTKGEQLFAGGRHNGSNIEVEVNKQVDQSYLTQLWNNETFNKQSISNTQNLINNISKYFTIIVLIIALATFISWYIIDPTKMYQVFTAVLIVACPCALALSIPFSYGNILRLLSSIGLYIKDTSTIEKIQDIDHIILDKTGTITDSSEMDVRLDSKFKMTSKIATLIKTSCFHSSHPLSKAIVQYFEKEALTDIDEFKEHVGQGIESKVLSHRLKIGSSAFLFNSVNTVGSQSVFIEIDGKYYGRFTFKPKLREGIDAVINALSEEYELSMLSGDNNTQKSEMANLFGSTQNLFFDKSPHDKLEYVKRLQQEGKKVMMIGDGLNDAGALKQSDVGIVISDKVNNFSPACDAILEAKLFGKFKAIIAFLRVSRYLIFGAFGLAFLYNFIGLSFAVTAKLTPVVAAILMPISSITVIIYGLVGTYLLFLSLSKKLSLLN